MTEKIFTDEDIEEYQNKITEKNDGTLFVEGNSFVIHMELWQAVLGILLKCKKLEEKIDKIGE